MATPGETPRLSVLQKLVMAAGGLSAYMGLTMLGIQGARVADRWLIRQVYRWADRGRTPAPAAAADVDPDALPEPVRPGVYRCRSTKCGYHWARMTGPDERRWVGPFLANGEMPAGPVMRTWREIDEGWIDCTARLDWVGAALPDYLREAKKGSAS